ncbi:hypothetical protein [Salegentibacter sp. F14]
MANDPETNPRKVAVGGNQYIEAAEYREGAFYNMFHSEFNSLTNENDIMPVSSPYTNGSKGADRIMRHAKPAGFKYYGFPIIHFLYLQRSK